MFLGLSVFQALPGIRCTQQLSMATKITAINSALFVLGFCAASIYEPHINYLSLIHDPEFSAFLQK